MLSLVSRARGTRSSNVPFSLSFVPSLTGVAFPSCRGPLFGTVTFAPRDFRRDATRVRNRLAARWDTRVCTPVGGLAGAARRPHRAPAASARHRAVVPAHDRSRARRLPDRLRPALASDGTGRPDARVPGPA